MRVRDARRVSAEHIKVKEHPASCTEHTYHDNYTPTKVQDSGDQQNCN